MAKRVISREEAVAIVDHLRTWAGENHSALSGKLETYRNSMIKALIGFAPPPAPRAVKPRGARSKKYEGPWALFSVHKASEGGMSFNDAKELLVAAGIEPVRRGPSIYVGQYGLEVPKKFEDKASDVLFS